MKNVLITGASGYLGQQLINALANKPSVEKIVALDIRPRTFVSPKVVTIQHDVTRPMSHIFAEDEIDTAVHLAFVLDPIHNRERERAINVEGTRNFFTACADSGVQTILMASSATVYGAWPDNPECLTEESPLRGKPGFSYVDDKLIMEQLADEYTAVHPTTRLIRTRVAVAVGPTMNNYLARFFRKSLAFMVRGADPTIGIVHEQDVGRAKLALLEQAPTGAYNIAAPGLLRLSQILHMMGTRPWAVPASVAQQAAGLAWRLRWSWLSEAPPIMLDYIRYNWAVDGSKLTRVTDFTYQYDAATAVAHFAAHTSS